MASKKTAKVKSYPDNNPKAAIGASKIPLHLVPPSATHYLAMALKDGAAKYGPYNWRDAGISLSTYKSASDRHWAAYWDGENVAKDSKVHHLAHAAACAIIALDAETIGMLVDDRPTPGAAIKMQEDFAETLATVLAKAARMKAAATRKRRRKAIR